MDDRDRPAADRILDAIGHAIIATDLDGRIRYWNRAAEALYGWPAAEALGSRVTDLIDPRPRPEDGLAELRNVAGGAPGLEVFEARGKDGSTIPVRVTAGPLRDENDEVIGVVGTSVDVSRLVALEGAVTRVRTYLDMAGRSGVGSWDWHLPSGVFTIDEGVRHVLGLPPGKTHMTVEEVLATVHPDDVAGLRGDLEEATTRASTWDEAAPEARYRIVRPDGEVRHLIGRSRLVASTDGRAERVAGILIDVTETHAATMRVVETLEAMSDGYYAVDADWRVTYINRAAEELLDSPRNTVLGRSLWEAFARASGTHLASGTHTGSGDPLDAGTHLADVYREAMATQQPAQFRAFLDWLGSWYEFRAYPSPAGLSVYLRNIDEELAATVEREQLLEAERAARVSAESARAELLHAAAHDPLTGLANRVALRSWIDQALARAARPGSVALLYCDLDRFKYINDSLGHSVGDQVLVEIAEILCHSFRSNDLVCRIGGDEFVIGVEDATEEMVASEVLRLLHAVRTPLDVSGRRLVTTTSVGIAFSSEGATAETLLRDADAALYRAKRNGRNRAAVFDEELLAEVVTRLELEADLHTAVETDQLQLVFQPSFDTRSGDAVAVEALARWHHPQRGLVMPGDFIPIAEDSGLIVPIGARLLETATNLMRSTPPGIGVGSEAIVWLNVSGRQLTDTDLVADVLAHLDGLQHRFGLEVTETVLQEDEAPVVAALRELSEHGIHIAIDDFGTGYSSLARLTEYPLDVLKVDRRFIHDIDSPQHRAVAAAAIQLAHAMGARAVAEGVETAAQLEALTDLGCDHVAGFFLSRPVAWGDIDAAAAAGSRALRRHASSADR